MLPNRPGLPSITNEASAGKFSYFLPILATGHLSDSGGPCESILISLVNVTDSNRLLASGKSGVRDISVGTVAMIHKGYSHFQNLTMVSIRIARIVKNIYIVLPYQAFSKSVQCHDAMCVEWISMFKLKDDATFI